VSLRLRLLLPLVLLNACNAENENKGSTTQTPVSLSGACRSALFEGSEFTNCVATPGRESIRTYLTAPAGQPLRSLGQLKALLGKDAESIAFAMNAGMFDDAGKPIGYYVEQGIRSKMLNRNKGGGNFHLLPNGVFSVEGDGWHIRTSDTFADTVSKRPSYATQSGPMLVIDGKLHPQIAANGPSINIRNAIGIDTQGRAHFVISEVPVSFGRIARFMRDSLKCTNALYLDGAVSALWYPAGDRLDASVPLGPLIVAEKAAKEPI
jgi:uncharacterized protein YigE (DUF2233 family)